jgi:eukaryotic-like serine/threonine-protein kinase
VAVKKLRLRPGVPQAKAAEATARCLREGRIAARLHHPNAISVFDVVDEDDVPNLVMEYMPSRSMATVIAEDGPLEPEAVAAVGAQVAAALAAAHDAGIVHRDITPGNVLLGEHGLVKLTDFGISRATDDVASTKTGPFAGTPAYLAPEVAHGAAPTPASDVFSLGATLYAAIEGAPPFGRAGNVLAVLHAVAGGEINPPQRSGPLTDLLLALLAADPAARPTAAQAHDLLAAAGPDEVPVSTSDDAPAVAAAPTARIQKPAPSTGRSHKPLAAAGVLVVALAAVSLWLLGSQNGTLPTHERAPADGGVHNHTKRPAGSAPVTPVGEPIAADKTRQADKPSKSHRGAPKGDHEAAKQPPANGDTAPAPVTTPEEPTEPTTSAPPTSEPTSSEAAPTAPG